MDSRGLDKMDDLPAADTPEDVAVLYSWANLHGAKYRDFSASRREYRAQLRHRAAEQVREQELKAQAEAEAAAYAAEAAVQQAESAAQSLEDRSAESSRQLALREAGRASRIASAERVEAARRAEAAALAEAVARREEREIAEANASARRQAARYAESEIRSRESVVHRAAQVPGQTSDPYTKLSHPLSQPQFQPLPPQHLDSGYELPTPPQRVPQEFAAYQTPTPAYRPVPIEPAVNTPPPGSQSSRQRRPQGYRPDDASGVRQIYRGPEFEDPQGEYVAVEPVRHVTSTRGTVSAEAVPADQRNKPSFDHSGYAPRPATAPYTDQFLSSSQRDVGLQPLAVRASYPEPAKAPEPLAQGVLPGPSGEQFDPAPAPRAGSRRESAPHPVSGLTGPREPDISRIAGGFQSASPRVPAPLAQVASQELSRVRQYPPGDKTKSGQTCYPDPAGDALATLLHWCWRWRDRCGARPG